MFITPQPIYIKTPSNEFLCFKSNEIESNLDKIKKFANESSNHKLVSQVKKIENLRTTWFISLGAAAIGGLLTLTSSPLIGLIGSVTCISGTYKAVETLFSMLTCKSYNQIRKTLIGLTDPGMAEILKQAPA